MNTDWPPAHLNAGAWPAGVRLYVDLCNHHYSRRGVKGLCFPYGTGVLGPVGPASKPQPPRPHQRSSQAFGRP